MKTREALKIKVTKEEERRKRKSEGKERRRRKQAIVALLVFIIVTYSCLKLGGGAFKLGGGYNRQFTAFQAIGERVIQKKE